MPTQDTAVEKGLSSPTMEPVEHAPGSYAAFSQPQKTLSLAIVTGAAMSTFLSADIYLPLLPTLAADLNVSISMVNLTVAFFMFIFAIGPLVYAGFSDVMGRKPSYTIALLVYTASNVALAAAPAHYASFVALRIIQGFGASGLYSVGAATVADIFEPSQRGRAVSYFNLGPQLGPIIGPAIGGALAQREGWRWIFWFLGIISHAIFGGASLFAIVLFLPETLASKVNIDRKQPWVQWPPFRRRVQLGQQPAVRQSAFRQGLLSLLKLPTVIISAINTALMFASYFCLAVSLPALLEVKYDFTTVEIGLAYLAPGIAMACGSLGCGYVSDLSCRKRQKREESAEIEPEFRLRLQVVGTALCPAGVLLYGWLGNFGIGAPGVIIAVAIVAFALSWTMSTNNTYLTLVRPCQAATAVALSALLMIPSGAIGTAIIAPLIEAEGFGWCFTGLALIDMICTPMAVLSLVKGTAWRKAIEKNEIQGQASPTEDRESQNAGDSLADEIKSK